MKMEVLYDEKSNKGAVYSLWQQAFRDPEPFADYYFQWVYPQNQVLLIKQGDEIRSMLHLNPYRFRWNPGGEKPIFLELHYIVGVATAAAYRRQGMMAACMRKALEDLEAREEPFTYLMPANTEYYTPFQFVSLTKERRWVRQAEGWIPKEKNSGTPRNGFPMSSPEERFSISPERSPDYFRRLRAEVQCEHGDLLEWEDDGIYCAYVMEQQKGRQRAILQQVMTASGNTEQVLNQRICPELYRRYGEIDMEYIESQPMMLRILKLSRFLELLPYEKEEKQCIVHLTDAICRGNQGDFVITLSPEGCSLCRLEEWQGMAAGHMPEFHWGMWELTEYLLEESRLADRMYLMEIV